MKPRAMHVNQREGHYTIVSVPDDAQHRRRDHGHRSAHERRQPLSAIVGRAEPVRRSGSCAFPQNAGYNPTGTVGALAYWAAHAIRNAIPEEARFADVGMMTQAIAHLRSRCRWRSPRARLCAVAPQAASRARRSHAEIERGRYLVAAGDCAACHTDERRPAVRRRPRDSDAVRHDLLDEHHARSRNRHWQVDRPTISTARCTRA